MELFDHSGCEDLEASCFWPLISYVRAKNSKTHAPPYIPHWDLMPLHKLCQLALLWKSAGFVKEAGQLAHWLRPLASFLPLWCPEKEYNEKAAEQWLSRLSDIEPIEPDTVPDFGLTLFSSPSLSSAFTLAGNGTSLGMIRAGGVEIRALGPQSPLLSFGIKGRGEKGWARTFALPEVWLELKTQSSETSCKVDVRFVGLKPETPLEFAFYVKAPKCQIGQEVLKPKSLRRYNGEASSVLFQNLKIEVSTPHKVRVIPLAGEGCFWDCEFLAAFEIPPFDPQVSFTIVT
ncbi:MAG TPA: hypothetical protein VLF94_07275 [Chlamydiales bacterium]|nr:hypothetical protein [Chlamydiales bacterium]